jgi:hypothetical protein
MRASLSILSLLPILPIALAALGCATLAEADGGDVDLPNAGAGPFREIRDDELGNLRSAPNALVDDNRFAEDPSILDADGDAATLEAWGYFAIHVAPEGEDADPLSAPAAIARYAAPDGRSFDRAPVVVLEPALAWEGGTIGAPMALRRGGEIWLYYAAAGGIGLARGADGVSFTREAEPVLTAATAGWDAGLMPASPAVVELWDGSLRLFYEVRGADGAARIGEARSADGVAWARVGAEPALAPSAAAAGGDEPYDDASTGAPFATLAQSPEGRRIVRVYYAAVDGQGRGTIGLAARVGAEGPLERAVSPVFGTGDRFAPRAPCVALHDGFSLLFATQRKGRGDAEDFPAVAAGVAPATAVLPAPAP